MTELFRDLAAGDTPRALGRGLMVRRAVMVALAAVTAAALLDVFGQRAVHSTASGTGAQLRLTAPRTVRGGLLFEARLTITPRADVGRPRLLLDQGWIQGLQFNSLEPEPESVGTRDGRLELAFAPLTGGRPTFVIVQFQVNPTNVGRQSFNVELDDGDRPLAKVDRTLNVLP